MITLILVLTLEVQGRIIRIGIFVRLVEMGVRVDVVFEVEGVVVGEAERGGGKRDVGSSWGLGLRRRVRVGIVGGLECWGLRGGGGRGEGRGGGV